MRQERGIATGFVIPGLVPGIQPRASQPNVWIPGTGAGDDKTSRLEPSDATALNAEQCRLPTLHPVSFGLTGGWLHGGSGTRGVVIAGSIGLEALCSHRFLRLTAERLAASGTPTLRFDWSGSGDAAGSLDDASVAQWTADLAAAIDKLKELTGIREVVLIGFRLGGLIAQALAARPDVTGLALVAPPASGKSYVRELTAIARLIDGALAKPPLEALDPTDVVPEGALQAAGFRLPAVLLDDIRKLAWSRPPEGRRVLVVTDPQALPPAFAGEWEASGLAVERKIIDGYQSMMGDPTSGDIPHAAIAGLADWIGPSTLGTPLSLPVAAPLTGPGWREERVLFGPDDTLAGVWCVPSDAPPRDTIVFANAGAISHGGWARMSVEQARMLAADGVASLRFDFAETGDSPAAPDGARSSVYDARARADLAAAIDLATARGAPRVTLVGTCSGAHHAFHVAAADPRVARLALVNVLCLIWGPAYAIRLKAARAPEAPVANPEVLTAQARLVRLVRGRIRAAAKAGLALASSGTTERLIARLTGRGGQTRAERLLRTIAARGTSVLLVSSEGDGSIAEIERHFGPGARAIADLKAVQWRRIPAADHTLTPPHARRMLAAMLGDFTKP